MTNRVDIYQEVTDQIIAELENGVLPWVREWDGCGIPSNAITGRAYNGINTLILWAKALKMGYTSNRWCTYKQAKDAGAQVAKGEKGTRVVFYKAMTKEDKETGETVTFPMLRAFTVFNVDQIDGLDDGEKDERPAVERLAAADEFVNNTGAVIVEGEPAYFPKADKISMPEIDAFKSQAGYYATLFHELTHWTGHESRLARAKSGRFGSESYALEELCAELGASFLCAEIGVPGEVRHAGYIQSWLKALKSDKKAIFTAAAAASRAVEYLKEIQGKAATVAA